MTRHPSANIDEQTVEGFGEEWSSFDQSELRGEEYRRLFDRYFGIFPFDEQSSKWVGFDLGCGTGRWAAGVASQVAMLHCIDPSAKALAVAQQRLSSRANVQFHLAAADTIPLPNDSMDFGYSLGVLHHVPDTAKALIDCVSKLKPGAPFLLYLYYRFDNRPVWFKSLWAAIDQVRRIVSRLPFRVRKTVTTIVAATVYWPLARASLLAENVGLNVQSVPLSAYRHLGFYTMRTDALDRLGTRLEQRFTKEEIAEMMTSAGLGSIRFSDREPYWVAIGNKEGSGGGVPSVKKRTTPAKRAATASPE